MTNIYTKSTDRCISTRNACPTSQVTSCSHTEDITIECSQLQLLYLKNLYFFVAYNIQSSSTTTNSTCIGKLSKKLLIIMFIVYFKLIRS